MPEPVAPQEETAIMQLVFGVIIWCLLMMLALAIENPTTAIEMLAIAASFFVTNPVGLALLIAVGVLALSSVIGKFGRRADMTRFDRFERDLLRRLWFNCIYCFIVFAGLPLVFVYASNFIFGWSTSSVGEILPYTLNISWIIAVLGTLGEEMLDLKRDVEQLKLANTAQVRE